MKTRLAGCLVIACFAGSCRPLSCTEAGCVGGVFLGVHAPAGWQQGQHELRLEAEGGTTHACSFGVTVQATTTEIDPDGFMCTSGLRPSFVRRTGCPALLGSAGAGPADPGCWLTPLQFHLMTEPRSLRVRLVRDGSVLVDQTMRPEYNRLAPNGEACGPICHIANVGLSVP